MCACPAVASQHGRRIASKIAGQRRHGQSRIPYRRIDDLIVVHRAVRPPWLIAKPCAERWFFPASFSSLRRHGIDAVASVRRTFRLQGAARFARPASCSRMTRRTISHSSARFAEWSLQASRSVASNLRGMASEKQSHTSSSRSDGNTRDASGPVLPRREFGATVPEVTGSLISLDGRVGEQATSRRQSAF